MKPEGLTAAGREVVAKVVVRPCARDEWARCVAMMRRHHYLGFRGVVGERLGHVAEVDGRWVALLVWAAGAMKCQVRDAWIGWHPSIAWQRLPLVVNNVRFLVLPGVEVPNLASRVLGMSVRRLSSDWQQAWGHPVLMAETFVDPRRYSGTCYRAAGWTELGLTEGFARHCGGWSYHGHRKVVMVRELTRQARGWLADPRPRPELSRRVSRMRLADKEIAALKQVLRTVPDPRRQQGVRHHKLSLLSICVVAVLSGARSFEAMAQWARECTQAELARLGCRRHPRNRRYVAPSEPTIRRFLQSIDVEAVDTAIGAWVHSLYASDQNGIAIDGKTLRGARRKDGTLVHLLSAVLQSSGVTVAQTEVGCKTNEIPCAAPLLAPLELRGRLVTADALHTQTELARFLVEQKQAHYCFTVKDNQPTLRSDIDLLFADSSFPPSPPND
jgi:hypothetical protein